MFNLEQIVVIIWVALGAFLIYPYMTYRKLKSKGFGSIDEVKEEIKKDVTAIIEKTYKDNIPELETKLKDVMVAEISKVDKIFGRAQGEITEAFKADLEAANDGFDKRILELKEDFIAEMIPEILTAAPDLTEVILASPEVKAVVFNLGDKYMEHAKSVMWGKMGFDQKRQNEIEQKVVDFAKAGAEGESGDPMIDLAKGILGDKFEQPDWLIPAIKMFGPMFMGNGGGGPPPGSQGQAKLPALNFQKSKDNVWQPPNQNR